MIEKGSERSLYCWGQSRPTKHKEKQMMLNETKLIWYRLGLVTKNVQVKVIVRLPGLVT